jgi:hypothetical protein
MCRFEEFYDTGLTVFKFWGMLYLNDHYGLSLTTVHHFTLSSMNIITQIVIIICLVSYLQYSV